MRSTAHSVATTLALCSTLSGQLAYTDVTGSAGQLSWDGGRTELELGDLNGDGHVDIVTVGDHGSPFINTQMHGITAWLGDGAGGWTLVQTGDFGYGGLALGDVNGDGFVDVGYGVHHDYSASDLGDQLLEVALGDGTATQWIAWDDGLATAGETWGMFACDFGDIDGDGDLDLASISFGCCSGVQVYTNDGDGSWTHTFGFLGGNSDETIQFADFDGDGNLDLVAGHQDGSVYRGDGAGGFVQATGNLPSAWLGVAAGDVNGDGRDEFSFRNSQGGAEVWTWTPGDVWISMSGNLATGGVAATQLADMNVDGSADLVAFGDGRARIYSWSPGDVWNTIGQAAVTSGGTHEALRAGVDIDHNGYPDLAFVQGEPRGIFETENEMYVLAEDSTPSTLAPRLLAPSVNRRWIGGQTRFVDWTNAVPAGDVATIELELSFTGTSGPWLPLGSALPDNGRHQISVPSGVRSSTCHVRLTATTANDSVQLVGPAFTIDAPSGIAPFGCEVNPPGSLAVVGQPQIGGTVALAIDDPVGSSAAPATGFALLSLDPDPNFPCGTLLPGLGMSGPSGELLVGIAPPDPVLVLVAPGSWTTPGTPVTAELAIPSNPSLAGLVIYTQGALLGAGTSRITAAVALTIG